MKVRITAGEEDTGITPEIHAVGDVVEVSQDTCLYDGRWTVEIEGGKLLLPLGLHPDWYEEV